MVPGEAEKTERLNTSPYAFGAIPENELLRIKGHSKIKCAVKWAKKGKSAVEIASMYGILRITPITPEVIRISFVKGVTAKVQDTYWKPKADTAFPWSAKESKTAVLVETEKLRVMVEKKDGAVQFLTPDNKPILSEKRDEPRMIDGGMTWTFFDCLFWRKAGADAAACFEPRLRHCGRRVPDGTAVQCTDVWNVSSHRRGRTD